MISQATCRLLWLLLLYATQRTSADSGEATASSATCVKRSALLYTSGSTTYTLSEFSTSTVSSCPAPSTLSVFATTTLSGATTTLYLDGNETGSAPPQATYTESFTTREAASTVTLSLSAETACSTAITAAAPSGSVVLAQESPITPSKNTNFFLITFPGTGTTGTSARKRQATAPTFQYNLTQSFQAITGRSYTISVSAEDASLDGSTPQCSVRICPQQGCSQPQELTSAWASYMYTTAPFPANANVTAILSFSCSGAAYVGVDDVDVQTVGPTSTAQGQETVTETLTKVVSGNFTQSDSPPSTVYATSTIQTTVTASASLANATCPSLSQLFPSTSVRYVTTTLPAATQTLVVSGNVSTLLSDVTETKTISGATETTHYTLTSTLAAATQTLVISGNVSTLHSDITQTKTVSGVTGTAYRTLTTTQTLFVSGNASTLVSDLTKTETKVVSGNNGTIYRTLTTTLSLPGANHTMDATVTRTLSGNVSTDHLTQTLPASTSMSVLTITHTAPAQTVFTESILTRNLTISPAIQTQTLSFAQNQTVVRNLTMVRTTTVDRGLANHTITRTYSVPPVTITATANQNHANSSSLANTTTLSPPCPTSQTSSNSVITVQNLCASEPYLIIDTLAFGDVYRVSRNCTLQIDIGTNVLENILNFRYATYEVDLVSSYYGAYGYPYVFTNAGESLVASCNPSNANGDTTHATRQKPPRGISPLHRVKDLLDDGFTSAGFASRYMANSSSNSATAQVFPRAPGPSNSTASITVLNTGCNAVTVAAIPDTDMGADCGGSPSGCPTSTYTGETMTFQLPASSPYAYLSAQYPPGSIAMWATADDNLLFSDNSGDVHRSLNPAIPILGGQYPVTTLNVSCVPAVEYTASSLCDEPSTGTSMSGELQRQDFNYIFFPLMSLYCQNSQPCMARFLAPSGFTLQLSAQYTGQAPTYQYLHDDVAVNESVVAEHGALTTTPFTIGDQAGTIYYDCCAYRANGTCVSNDKPFPTAASCTTSSTSTPTPAPTHANCFVSQATSAWTATIQNACIRQDLTVDSFLYYDYYNVPANCTLELDIENALVLNDYGLRYPNGTDPTVTSSYYGFYGDYSGLAYAQISLNAGEELIVSCPSNNTGPGPTFPISTEGNGDNNANIRIYNNGCESVTATYLEGDESQETKRPNYSCNGSPAGCPQPQVFTGSFNTFTPRDDGYAYLSAVAPPGMMPVWVASGPVCHDEEGDYPCGYDDEVDDNGDNYPLYTYKTPDGSIRSFDPLVVGLVGFGNPYTATVTCVPAVNYTVEVLCDQDYIGTELSGDLTYDAPWQSFLPYYDLTCQANQPCTSKFTAPTGYNLSLSAAWHQNEPEFEVLYDTASNDRWVAAYPNAIGDITLTVGSEDSTIYYDCCALRVNGTCLSAPSVSTPPIVYRKPANRAGRSLSFGPLSAGSSRENSGSKGRFARASAASDDKSSSASSLIRSRERERRFPLGPAGWNSTEH